MKIRRLKRDPAPVIGVSDMRFLELFDAQAVAVTGFFAQRTLDPEAAADLTAETFAEAFASRRSFDPSRGSVDGWLWGIARHRLAGYLQATYRRRDAQARVGLPERALSADDYERIEELIDFAAFGRKVKSALDDLPAPQKEAVTYRVIEGLSYAEIGRRVGCTPELARTRVSRGLGALARSLIPEAPTTTTPGDTP